jgi:hypothetical protein
VLQKFKTCVDLLHGGTVSQPKADNGAQSGCSMKNGSQKSFGLCTRIRFGDIGQGCIRWLDRVEDVEDCAFARQLARSIGSRGGVM